MNEITSHWVWKDLNGNVIKQETRTLYVNIQERPRDGLCDERTVITFERGPTGFETYRLDETFVGTLRDLQSRGGILCICAGTSGSWPTCTVPIATILEVIRAERPELLPE